MENRSRHLLTCDRFELQFNVRHAASRLVLSLGLVTVFAQCLKRVSWLTGGRHSLVQESL